MVWSAQSALGFAFQFRFVVIFNYSSGSGSVDWISLPAVPVGLQITRMAAALPLFQGSVPGKGDLCKKYSARFAPFPGRKAKHNATVKLRHGTTTRSSVVGGMFVPDARPWMGRVMFSVRELSRAAIKNHPPKCAKRDSPARIIECTIVFGRGFCAGSVACWQERTTDKELLTASFLHLHSRAFGCAMPSRRQLG